MILVLYIDPHLSSILSKNSIFKLLKFNTNLDLAYCQTTGWVFYVSQNLIGFNNFKNKLIKGLITNLYMQDMKLFCIFDFLS